MNAKGYPSLLLVSLLCFGNAQAEERLEKGIPLGDWQLYPSIPVSVRYENNYKKVSDQSGDPEADEGSAVLTVSPQASLELHRSDSSYVLRAGTGQGVYGSDSSENWTDVWAGGNANWQFTRRADASVNAQYKRGHDERGTTDRYNPDGPNTWNSYALRGMAGYGRLAAKGRIEVLAGYSTRRYEDFPLAEKVDDTNRYDLEGRFYYQIMPKTQLLFSVKQANTDYVNTDSLTGQANRDRVTRHYHVGAIWEATAKTTGTAEIGWATVDFDHDGYEDSSHFNWVLGMDWKPRHTDLVNITTGRRTEDATGIGSALDVMDSRVIWKHLFGLRWASQIGVQLKETDYYASSREDEEWQYNVGMTYQFRKWLALGLHYLHGVRESSMDEYDFDTNAFMFTVNFHLQEGYDLLDIMR